MKKQQRISVSFSREYHIEYEYLMELANSSDFICRAVREKIQGINKVPFELEKCIKDTLIKVISEKSILSVTGISHDIPNDSNTDQSLLNAAAHFEL
jgi:hypothetical protein